MHTRVYMYICVHVIIDEKMIQGTHTTVVLVSAILTQHPPCKRPKGSDNLVLDPCVAAGRCFADECPYHQFDRCRSQEAGGVKWPEWVETQGRVIVVAALPVPHSVLAST